MVEVVTVVLLLERMLSECESLLCSWRDVKWKEVVEGEVVAEIGDKVIKSLERKAQRFREKVCNEKAAFEVERKKQSILSEVKSSLVTY